MKMEKEDFLSTGVVWAAQVSSEKLYRAALLIAGEFYEPNAPADVQHANEQALREVLAMLGYRVSEFNAPVIYRDPLGRPNRHYTKKRESAKLVEVDPTKVTASGATKLACGPDVGTVKGYNRHLTTYTVPCSRCLAARRRELEDRWTNLGLPAYARGRIAFQ